MWKETQKDLQTLIGKYCQEGLGANSDLAIENREFNQF